MQWKPPIQGGNGRGPTVPQLLMASTLGWDMELAVCTGMKRGSGFPTCYKLDVANRDLKIGIEVNGEGHQALKIQEVDRKKKEFLESKGWIVLSFTNRQITQSLAECIGMVSSTISKLKETTTTSQTTS
jgi:hypothetical protein